MAPVLYVIPKYCLENKKTFPPDTASSTRLKTQTWPQFKRYALDNKERVLTSFPGSSWKLTNLMNDSTLYFLRTISNNDEPIIIATCNLNFYKQATLKNSTFLDSTPSGS